MKRTILLFLLSTTVLTVNAQIFVKENSDKSITITPRGILGRDQSALVSSNTVVGLESQPLTATLTPCL